MKKKLGVTFFSTLTFFIFLLIALFSLLITTYGCTSLGFKNGIELSSKQKAVWINNVYLGEYEKYEKEIVRHNADVNLKPDDQLNEDELQARNQKRDLFKLKKEILIKLKPMVEAYNGYVETDQIPPQEIEKIIVGFINSLLE